MTTWMDRKNKQIIGILYCDSLPTTITYGGLFDSPISLENIFRVVRHPKKESFCWGDHFACYTGDQEKDTLANTTPRYDFPGFI